MSVGEDKSGTATPQHNTSIRITDDEERSDEKEIY